MTENAASENEHADQSLPYEWGEARWDGERFIVRDVPEGMAELYRVVKSTKNLRVLAQAEAVIFQGKVLTPEFQPDYKGVDFYHDYGGRMGGSPVDGWLRNSAFVLEPIHVATSILDFPERSADTGEDSP